MATPTPVTKHDSENFAGAIALLESSIAKRLQSHGADDDVVKRKQAEVTRLKSKLQLQASRLQQAQAQPK